MTAGLLVGASMTVVGLALSSGGAPSGNTSTTLATVPAGAAIGFRSDVAGSNTQPAAFELNRVTCTRP